MPQVSQNKWPVQHTSDNLHEWVIPVRARRWKGDTIRVRLRNGSAGFLLAHFILWWFDRLEKPVIPGLWGHYVRSIIDSKVISNHASGTAADINAPLHPLGKKTMGWIKRRRIRRRLKSYGECLRSGAFYTIRLDEMHVEIDKPMKDCERWARLLCDSPRGKRILAANPGQREIIFR